MSVDTVLAKWKAAMVSLGLPYGLGQYLTPAGQELPDVFMVGTLISGAPLQHADNLETQRDYRIQVSIYSRSGLAGLPGVDAAMIAQGFSLGPERQLPYDTGTRHYGVAKDYFYLM